MFTDERRVAVWDLLRHQDLRAFRSWLSPEVLTDAAGRAKVRMGRGPLHVGNLVWLAVAAALQMTKNFNDILIFTFKALYDTPGFAATPLGRVRTRDGSGGRQNGRSKHDPHGRGRTTVSEEAFTKSRRILSVAFWTALLQVLVERFEARYGTWTRWHGFRLLALDSTNLRMANWKALLATFGTLTNGKGSQRPQARLVLLQFPLVRLPYRYELVPIREGEKVVAERLLQGLRPDDLVLQDRGFWSYRLFCVIQGQGAFFVIRRSNQGKLKNVQRLGDRDWLVRWTPRDKKWVRQGFPAFLMLRVIGYRIKGFRPSAVVTNILDPRVASREDFIRLSTEEDPDRRLDPGLYHRRWEIETTFEELKVIQALQGSFRSRTPEGIRYEVAGHVILYFLIRALMVQAAVTHDQLPLRLSFTHALLELGDLRLPLLTSSLHRACHVLLPRLCERIASHKVPERPGRHYRRPHDTDIKKGTRGRIRLPSKLPPSPSKLKRKELKKMQRRKNAA
jgi:hypothetical protein